MAELVGHADCPECRKNAGVFQGKRGRFIDCRSEFGGDGCSIFRYQSKVAQKKLADRTRPLSENPTPAVGEPATKVEPKPEVKPEPKPEPKAKKPRFSLFGKRSTA